MRLEFQHAAGELEQPYARCRRWFVWLGHDCPYTSLVRQVQSQTPRPGTTNTDAKNLIGATARSLHNLAEFLCTEANSGTTGEQCTSARKDRAHSKPGGKNMARKIIGLTFLGKGGSEVTGCPSLYVTELDNGEQGYLAQGWKSGRPEVIEIPHLLLGFAQPDTFIGAAMTDTGRGTFTLTGEPITDPEVLSQLDLAANEAAVEVPLFRRTYYGAAPTE